MNTAECRITTAAARDKFRVYVIGDLHSDSLCFDETRLRAFVRFVARDPQCVVVCVGDYVEGRVPGQRHFDPKALIPEARLHIGDYVSWALDRSEKLLAPLRALKGRVFLVKGNHDHYMEWTDFTGVLANRLGAVNLQDEGMVRLLVGGGRGSTGADCLTLYATHGAGGAGLPGAKVNAMQRFTGWLDADVIIAGHVHDSMLRVVPRLGLTTKGAVKLVQQPVALLRAPSFIRRAVQGVNTYASRKGYPTADDGILYLESVPRKVVEPGGGFTHWRDWVRHEFAPGP